MSGSGRSALASSSKPCDLDRQLALAGGHHRALDARPSRRGRARRTRRAPPPRARSADTKSCTVPDWSRMVANVSLPWRRSSRMRPATRTAHVGLGAGLEVAELGAQLGEGAVAVEADRVRVDAARPQRVEVGQPTGPFGRDVERGCGVGRGGVVVGRVGHPADARGDPRRGCAPFPDHVSWPRGGDDPHHGRRDPPRRPTSTVSPRPGAVSSSPTGSAHRRRMPTSRRSPAHWAPPVMTSSPTTHAATVTPRASARWVTSSATTSPLRYRRPTRRRDRWCSSGLSMGAIAVLRHAAEQSRVRRPARRRRGHGERTGALEAPPQRTRGAERRHHVHPARPRVRGPPVGRAPGVAAATARAADRPGHAPRRPPRRRPRHQATRSCRAATPERSTKRRRSLAASISCRARGMRTTTPRCR